MRLLFLVSVLCVCISHVASLTGDTFTVNCAPLTIQRSDPIVFPGAAGAHTHNVIGGNAFRRSMSGVYDARNANQTSCDKALDHSNYWVPSMYHLRSDGLFELVPWNHAAVYYQKRACDYAPGATSCDKSFVPLAFPDGLRMVAGDPYRRTQNDSDFTNRAVSIMCIYNGGSKEQSGFPLERCNLMRGQVYFPSCWDGKNIDSGNHQDHVSYPAIGDYNGGVCPQSHPKAIFSLFYEFFFDTSSFTDTNRFAFACGDSTAYGFHGDFLMGWTDRNALQNAHANCVDAQNCPTLGNQPAQSQPLVYPAVYEEDVGLKGPIPKLPGNNPVTWKNVANII